MIKLINGRGQLGEELNNLLKKDSYCFEEFKDKSVLIYHTWNILDKSKEPQEKCFEDFKRFADNNFNSRIVFTSTYSQTENYYNFYKQMSEAYLLNNHPDSYVIRLPTLMGKGVFKNFRDNKVKAVGEIELMTIEDAAKKTMDLTVKGGLIRSIREKGTIIPASLVKELILFGKNGK